MSHGTPTLKDVAREAGVDISTVSRVLRNTDDAITAAETRQRIIAVANSLGYRPNRVARALKTARWNSIGLVLPYLDHPVNHDLVTAVEGFAKACGLTVIIFHVDENHQPAHRLHELADFSQVDGMIIVARLIVEGEFGALESLGVPYVTINETGGVKDSVAVDHAKATAMATRHLLSTGHRDILLLPGPLGRHNAEMRHASFLATLNEAGADAERCRIVSSSHGYMQAFEAMRDALSQGLDASAIIAATTPIAMGAMAALSDARISVPDDVSVIAMHDSDLSRIVRPSLTAIDFPVRRLADVAVNELIKKIAGEPSGLPVKLDPLDLVLRQSSGPGPFQEKRR